MKALLKSTAAGAAMLAGIGAAHAEVKLVHRTGGWVTGAGINDHGYMQCTTGISGEFDNSQETLLIKYDAHWPKVVWVEFGKNGWHVPSGQQARVVLQVDNAGPRYYTAVGQGDDRLAIPLSFDDRDGATGEPAIRLLENLLKSGVQLKIWFTQGTEQPWVANLNGSAAELAQMDECVGAVAERLTRNAQHTQPYSGAGGSAPTQPYDNPQPVQPHPEPQQPVNPPANKYYWGA